MGFQEMWAALLSIGRDPGSGGYRRFAWDDADLACRDWFEAAALARSMPVSDDGNGNLFAWWGDPEVGNAVVTGSHLDSVPEGGAYDGPLGVVSGFAAVDELRARGHQPVRPVAVACFADEEGSRFGVACAGSRLLTGTMAPERALALRDRDDRTLAEVLRTRGRDPGRLGTDPDLLARIGAFVEVHVEQGRSLVHSAAAVGVATGIWPHGRWRFDFRGRADHAGTTAMSDRADPMLTYAMTALAANKQARLAAARATFGRVEVSPNGTNAIPSRVRAWLDARAESEGGLAALVDTVHRQSVERARRDGTQVDVHPESVTPAVTFDAPLRERLVAVLGDVPAIPTSAGHDAGILQTFGIPSAMLFVRNRSGVSHSPEEYADLDDCLAGVDALTRVLAELTS